VRGAARGSDAQLPGYDLGAYYAATGLATTINTPEMANAYATGFGDVATAGALVGAISVALRRRLVSGAGGLVTTALLRTAAFSLTPLLLTDSASEEQLRADRASAGPPGRCSTASTARLGARDQLRRPLQARRHCTRSIRRAGAPPR
jgi:crotonobetainyl-CoA:carnitine CoA-transferase CaiB-like acyl-CoA transferase